MLKKLRQRICRKTYICTLEGNLLVKAEIVYPAIRVCGAPQAQRAINRAIERAVDGSLRTYARSAAGEARAEYIAAIRRGEKPLPTEIYEQARIISLPPLVVQFNRLTIRNGRGSEQKKTIRMRTPAGIRL